MTTVAEILKNNHKRYEKIKYIENQSKLLNDINIDLTDIEDAKLYYLLSSDFSAQKKAPMGEKFLCKKLHLQSIPSSENNGDAKDSNGKIYEFKNSFTNQQQNLNIRQIRLWQNIDFYYCFYINEDDLDKSLFFVLTKEQMEKEVILCGSYTHGVTSINEENKYNEYSITIPIYNTLNEKTKRWKELYLSESLKQQIFGDKKL